MNVESASPSLGRFRRMVAVCDRFEAAWRAGEMPRLEAFLGEVIEPDRDFIRRELLVLEWELSGEADALPGLSQLADEARDAARRTTGLDRDDPSPETMAARPNSVQESIGVLGDFVLLDVLGRGGMGVVYRARQVGIGRVVALKVIRPELSEDLSAAQFEEVVSRFQTEARAAGSIHHDHIVEVYAFGEVDGRYYYAMRHVEGRNLAEVIGSDPFQGRRAAAILESVSRAVAHAHRCGVLHRDLKPRNILIDDADRPFITDFGLAKILQEVQGHTRTGELLGSPPYMSPEQVRDPSRVGPASDIYALGATLYEMITGRPPFRAADPLETLRQVVEVDPPKPRDLNPAIDRDLETIALKCLEKDPGRRYVSAPELADDLRRYLGGEPIRARPVGLPGRAWRWSRRRPALAAVSALASVAMVTIMALIVAFAWSQGRAADGLRAEQAATERQRLRAESNFRQARQSVRDYFVEVSQSDELRRSTRGLQGLRLKLLERALAYYRDFLRDSGDVVELRSEAAEAQYEAARIIDEIGRRDEAIQGYALARDRYDALVVAWTESPEPRRLRAVCNHDLGNALAAAGRIEEALGALRRSLAESEELARLEPDETTYRRDAIHARQRIADIQGKSVSLETTLTDYDGILRDQEAVVRDQPDWGSLRFDLGKMHVNYANLLRRAGRREAAALSYRRAIAILREASKQTPGDLAVRRHIALVYNNLGILSQEASRPKEAIDASDQARGVFQELARTQPAVPLYRNDLAGTYNNLGLLQAAQGQTAEAMNSYETALGLYERLASDDPEAIEYRGDLAASHLNLGVLLTSLKQYDRAIDSYSKALASFEALSREFTQSVEYRLYVAGTLQNIGDVRREAGRPEGSIDDYRRASLLLESLLAENPNVPAIEAVMGDVLGGLGTGLLALRRHAEAVDELNRAIRYQSLAFHSAPEITQYRRNLGASCDARSTALRALGRYDEAEESLRLHEEIGRDDPEERFRVACRLAEIGSSVAATRAIENLRIAVDSGFRDLDRFRRAEELSVLCGFPAFLSIEADLVFPKNPFDL